MFEDERIQKRFLEETKAEFERVIKPKGSYEERQRREIRAKDGFRLFDKLPSVLADAYAGSLRLIQPGASFREALATHHKLVGYVESIWVRAGEAYIGGQYPLAVFFAILAIEESGKMGRLWFDLVAWDKPEAAIKPKTLARKHPQKHFLGLVPGAVINARLDRILGAKQIKQVLEDAESGQLERLRQSCLYVDVIDGKTLLPEDIITEAQARFLSVLAGEMWVEILGHFPWEFEEMLAKVIAYEIKIGFSAELVKQS
jgi:AbiV family abortive infection protein